MFVVLNSGICSLLAILVTNFVRSLCGCLARPRSFGVLISRILINTILLEEEFTGTFEGTATVVTED